MTDPDTLGRRGPIRCAIYTRKSTEEGLEQQFNSLDAQYDACAAYIVSQRHEGWSTVKEHYDDGGFSGGTMDRPALKRLLADIAVSKVDVIVLYKIDRLTRSLADFSRIVDVLDKAGASFVSVTESFNTTTSMGRLMLNVLLSFAQFEREVTGERIRDKIAASKRKGMWMGGPVPLGYEVKERKLVINADEASIVRHIFDRYAELGSGQALLDELRESGIRTKRRIHGDGRVRGDVPFTRGSLFHLLKNRIYRGEMVHKEKAWPGEHQAIIDADLWDRVQNTIEQNRVDRKLRRNAKVSSLLAGMICDGLGRKMSPSHTVKNGKRYRYYITHSSEVSTGDPPWRLPAHNIEKAVVDRLTRFLEDRASIRGLIGANDAERLSSALSLCQHAAEQLRACSFHRRTKVPALIERIDIGDAIVSISLSATGLGNLAGTTVDNNCVPTLTAPSCRIRKGNEVKLVITDGAQVERDNDLIALLREAMAVKEDIRSAPDQTIAAIAAATGRCRKRLGKLLRLSWLAPEIVQAILEGRQPPTLTARALLRTHLPIDWLGQKVTLGFC